MKKLAILLLAAVLPGCATYAVPVGVVRVDPAPVVVYPQPVYRPVPIYATSPPVVYRPPVVYNPPPVVYRPPVVYNPPPVVYRPPVVYGYPGYGAVYPYRRRYYP